MSTTLKAARDLTPSPSTLWKDERKSLQQNSAQRLTSALRWRPDRHSLVDDCPVDGNHFPTRVPSPGAQHCPMNSCTLGTELAMTSIWIP
jgi:hypothetical protein